MRMVLIPHTGLMDYAVGLANALVEHGTVMLIAPQQAVQPFRRYIHADVNVTTVRSLRLRDPGNVVQARQIVRLIQQFRPDVVHFQGGFIWMTLVLPWLKRWPLVTTIHDHVPHRGDRHSKRTQWFMPNRFASRYSDALIVHSRYTQRQLGSLVPRNGPVVHYTHPGDGFLYVPPDPVATTEQFHVLLFGRLVAYKGLDVLMDAVRLVRDKWPNIRVCIAGEGHLPGTMRQELENSLHYRLINQYIEPPDVAELFMNARMVVLPYRDGSQSGVIPLAYSFGRPVIVSTVGGLHEIVDHDRTGLHVPPGDAPALARAILCLLQNDSRRREMGAQGLVKVKGELSWRHVARQTVTIYREVKASHASGKKAAYY